MNQIVRPPTVQSFFDATAKLTMAKDKKEYNKISLVALKHKRLIKPSEMVEALQQIEDPVLRGKVAGLVSFDAGDGRAVFSGWYDTLLETMKEYPKDLHPDDEPKQQDVYDCLLQIGYSPKQAEKISTVQDDEEDDE